MGVAGLPFFIGTCSEQCKHKALHMVILHVLQVKEGTAQSTEFCKLISCYAEDNFLESWFQL